MELNEKTLARLKQIADLLHIQTSSTLAAKTRQKQKLEAERVAAKGRLGAQMCAATNAEDMPIVALAQWSGSSDSAVRVLDCKIDALSPQIDTAMAATRHSFARTEALALIEDRLQAEDRQAKQRVEDRTRTQPKSLHDPDREREA